MSIIRITKEFSFEASHLLEGYDGACSQIHGHSYRLFVTVKGIPNPDPADPKYGMVMDFGALKKIVRSLIVDKYDHSLVVRRTPENSAFLETLKGRFDRIIETDYQPTCENMLPRFASVIASALPAGVSLVSMRLHETATSFAEYFAEDNL
ncbi:MAG: 6-carboxytetrahydropterin synthase [Alistipes sp.]|nr:6-carboxytetrahydropterin synthase [Alistipes sp.]